MSTTEINNITYEKQYQNSTNLPSTSLKFMSDDARHIFFGIFLIILVASVMGNVAVIVTISRKKDRYIQKVSVISLAISDLLTTVVTSINLLEGLSHPLVVWNLGEFLCSFIPFCQMLGITASSAALVVIAMDRHHNVVKALNKKWDPNLFYCILTALAIWLTIFAICYPAYTFFLHQPLTIFYVESRPIRIEESFLCACFEKDRYTIYYLSMTVIIFLPLLLLFFWFYYNIAALVWKHRKPFATNIVNKINNHDVELNSSSNNTKVTEISSNPSNKQINTHMSQAKNIRVERKIRSFKIIVAIMTIFIFCRLPYYVFYLIKLNYKPGGENMWILNYTFVALNVFNCVLNPLIYTFLKPTLEICAKIHKTISDFTCKVFCCCFSNADFEEYERENPFFIENFHEEQMICEKYNSKVEIRRTCKQYKY